MNEGSAGLLNELVKLAGYFSGRPAQPSSRIYGDLDINGSDYIEFVEELERRYAVDLSWISPPAASGASAQDATLEAIALDIEAQADERLRR